MVERNIPQIEWTYRALSFERNKTYDKVAEMMNREPRWKVLDIPTGTGILANRLRKMGFEMSCGDIHPSFFPIPDLKIELGNLNRSLPHSENSN